MDDVDEAKKLIREIRHARGVDEDGGLTENALELEKALRILSEDLYSAATHFIWEIVQNADDNKYHSDVTPRLSIVYRTDGFLWMGDMSDRQQYKESRRRAEG